MSASQIIGKNQDFSDTFHGFENYERNKENINLNDVCRDSISWKLSPSNQNPHTNEKSSLIEKHPIDLDQMAALINIDTKSMLKSETSYSFSPSE